MKINVSVRGREEYDDHVLNSTKSGCKEKVEKSKSLIWLSIDDTKLEPANNVNTIISQFEIMKVYFTKKQRKSRNKLY